MNKQDIDANIRSFETTGKLLTHPHVHCTCCNGATTMFGSKPGDNLMKRIAKYGNLQTLLTTFKCRVCSKGDAPVKQPAIKAAPVAAVKAQDAQYNSKSAAQAAALLSQEDQDKIFVMMPNGKLDYWWKQQGDVVHTSGITVTYEDGHKQHIAL